MFKELKNTFTTTVIYSLGNLSSKVIGFILLPLYTDYLSVSEYGILAILEATAQILIGIFGFNLTTSMMRWCASEKSLKSQKEIISSSFFTIVIIATIFSLVTIPNSGLISNLIFSSNKYELYVSILLLSISFGIISNAPLEVIRFREKATFYIFLTITKFILIVLLNIYFIVYENMGVEGVILSQLIGYIYILIIAAPFLFKNIIFSFKISIILEMIKFGLPLVFSTSALLALSLGDRYIIRFFIDDATVGIYSLGHKVASVINVLILQSFQMSFLPIAYKKINDENASRYFSKIATYLVFVLVFSGLVISIFSYEVIKTFSVNKDYWESYFVVPFVTLAFVFKGMQYVFALPFHFAKKTTKIAYIVTFAAFLNLLLNIVLIPKFGYLAAAVVMVLSYILMSILYYVFGKDYYSIPFEMVKFVKIILTGLLLYLPVLFITDMELELRLPIKLILIVFFFILLYYSNTFEPIEIEKISNSWDKWKNPFNWSKNIKRIKF